MGKRTSDEARIYRIIAGVIDTNIEEVRKDSYLVKDLEFDDVYMVELVFGLEDAYNISIDDREVDEWKKVSDVVECVNNILHEEA